MPAPHNPAAGGLAPRWPASLVHVVAWGGGTIFVASLGYFLYAYLVVYGRPAADGPWGPPAALNVALFTAFGLHHSAFARAGFRAWVSRSVDPRLERSVYVWISSALFLAVCWLWRPVPGDLYRLEGAWWWAGASVQIAGMLLTHFGSRALDALDLAGIRQVQRARRGRPPRLVTSGVYALVRHPFYFGWVLLVFGAPHMTMTRAVFAGVSTLYLVVAIPLEERGLVHTFGPDYEDYRRRVRWRMLPFVY
jgi:methanethiol S-methyltransferase